MARKLAECGTFTAYKRHKRLREDVDAACRDAARQESSARAAGPVSPVLVVPAPLGPGVDELGDALENYRFVKSAMRNASPREIAALSKQRAALVALIKRLESSDKPEVSALDEIARKRAERLAASSN